MMRVICSYASLLCIVLLLAIAPAPSRLQTLDAAMQKRIDDHVDKICAAPADKQAAIEQCDFVEKELVSP